MDVTRDLSIGEGFPHPVTIGFGAPLIGPTLAPTDGGDRQQRPNPGAHDIEQVGAARTERAPAVGHGDYHPHTGSPGIGGRGTEQLTGGASGVFKALLAMLGVAVIGIPVLLVLAAAFAGSGSTPPAKVPATGVDGRLSPTEVKYVAAAGLAAVFIGIVLGASTHPAAAFIPIGIWALISITMHYRAQSRPPESADTREALPAPRTREAFGKDGRALLERADAAVETVMASDAVQGGWLGPPDGMDLRADVRVIEDRLTRVSGIREVIAELSGVPDPSDADRKRKADAKHAEAKLHRDAQDRVTRLEKLAREVQATDRELRLRSLTDIDDADPATSPPVIDSTRAMLSAYREVKGLPDLESPPDGGDGKPDEARKPAASSPSFFDTLKRWWED